MLRSCARVAILRRSRWEFWGRYMCARGCFAVTIGSVNDEKVARFIEEQHAESQDGNEFKITR